MNTTQLKRLRRIRWAVRFALALGVGASVAANILHAQPHPISQAIAAWPPLALLLTVELVSRVPIHRRWLGALRVIATALIAGIAAWISYWHMAGTAARYGEGDSAYLLPLTVDGLIVVASISLVELATRIRVYEEPAPAEPVLVAGPVQQAVEILEGSPVAVPVPVSPAPVSRPKGRQGPQVTGPSRPSGLTGRVLLEEPPKR